MPHHRTRVQKWEIILARARALGFRILDESKEPVEAVRDHRKSRIDLVNAVVEANDQRDIWLLRQAVCHCERWEAAATYFVNRRWDGAIIPIGLRPGLNTDRDRLPYLEHDTPDGLYDTKTLRTHDDLPDVLPLLASSNTVGYHQARDVIVAAFERLRPKTWANIGIQDAALIAEFEEYDVEPDHVAHARAKGITATDAIIAAYGMPPLQWADDEYRSDQ